MALEIPDIFSEKRHLGETGGRLVRGAALVGAAGLAASAVLGVTAGDGGRGVFFSYLLSFAFFLSLSLGALFFVILQHLTKAGWSVVVRRLAEGVAATLPWMGLLFLPVLLGMHQLYHWSLPQASADPLLHAKRPYLNVPFFVVRWAVYLGVWWLLARFFLRRSLAQDGSGDVELTRRMEGRSALAMVAYAFTTTFASIDLLMSLDATWFSTMYGVYFFAGSVVGFFALLPLLAWWAQRNGLLRRAITVEHYHDMGKLLFGFVIFWAYIGFSQFMLIWYGNIPEETGWFLRRQTHGWGWIGLTLVVGHFVLPFVFLLSRGPKRRPTTLAMAAAWVLLMHLVDAYWLAIPEGRPGSPLPHLLDFTALVGVGGLWLAAAALALRSHSLVPERDPRLPESLSFENA